LANENLAARWNFINFQTPTYSAIMMEYTTPPSYGSTKVNVGGIVKDGKVVYAGTTNVVTHTEVGQDEGSDWPAPKAIKWEWSGKTTDDKEFTAEVDGALGPRLDRIDVMAEVPGFIKSIAGSVAGTRPYIFQVCMLSILPRILNILIFDTVLPPGEALTQAEARRRRDYRGGNHVLGVDLHLVKA
jgi:hypothetical protein